MMGLQAANSGFYYNYDGNVFQLPETNGYGTSKKFNHFSFSKSKFNTHLDKVSNTTKLI